MELRLQDESGLAFAIGRIILNEIDDKANGREAFVKELLSLYRKSCVEVEVERSKSKKLKELKDEAMKTFENLVIDKEKWRNELLEKVSSVINVES